MAVDDSGGEGSPIASIKLILAVVSDDVSVVLLRRDRPEFRPGGIPRCRSADGSGTCGLLEFFSDKISA